MPMVAGAVKKQQYMDMTTGKPFRLIILFSLPLIAGNLLQQVYYITDTIVIGKALGVAALAAVSSCTWVTWLINAIARDLSNACSIKASFSVGNRDRNSVHAIVANALMLSAASAVLLTAGIQFFMPAILRLFSVQEEIIHLTTQYLRVIAMGIPLILIFNTSCALLRAAGNSRITFLSISVSTVTNIVLDLFFVLVLKAGVRGAAVATVIAQGISAMIAFPMLLRSEIVSYDRKFWKPDPAVIKGILIQFLPMFLNSFVITLGGIIVTRAINQVGTYFTAGMSAGTKFYTLMEAVIMAIQASLGVFVGQNLGARKPDRIRKGVHEAVFYCLILVVFLNIITQAICPFLVDLFLSRDDPVIYQKAHEVGVHYIRVVTVGMFIMTPMYFFRISIQTFGHAEFATYGAMMQVIARWLSVNVLPVFFGLDAYFLGTVMAWAFTFPLVYFPYRHYLKKMLLFLPEQT